MRFGIWVVCCLSLLVLLWLVPHTNVVKTVKGYVVLPPPPPVPSPPGRPGVFDAEFLASLAEVFSSINTNVANLYNPRRVQHESRVSLCPCEPTVKSNRRKTTAARSLANVPTQSLEPNGGSLSLANALISGQQTLDVKKQETEASEKHLQQENEATEKRLRLYVQAGLTLLLSAVCLYLLVQKKTPPTQRAAAIGVLGIALGYWFK